MTVLSASTITRLCTDNEHQVRPMLSPFVGKKTIANGMSYGLSIAGYDVRIREGRVWQTGDDRFHLASTLEYFDMPNNVMGFVHDKSSWARQGLSLFNTVIEPGWHGFLTLELLNTTNNPLVIYAGSPIAQIIFMHTDVETDGYDGKYQKQAAIPTPAIFEGPWLNKAA